MKKTPITSKDEIHDSKVAVYMNMPAMSPPLELHTALIHDLLSRRNRVTVYLCDRSFRSPTWNPFNREALYSFGMFRAKDALRGLPITIRYINLKSVSSNIPEKKEGTLRLGVMSSLASITKAQMKEQLNHKWLMAYDSMYNSACKLYNFFVNELKEERYEYVFMFNGRFGCVKPVLEAVRDANMNFGLCEVKKTVHEIVFINKLTHSIGENGRKAFEFYEQNPEQAQKNAEDFYRRKVKHQNTGDPVYTQAQKEGALPAIIMKNNKILVVVYPTTEDEYKFIGKEWDGHVPESQVDEIDALAERLPKDRYFVLIKMHPNQATTAEGTVERYREIERRYSHVHVEDPHASSDTYALMYKADFVVTFASTIGVEACYAGKPVVLIGDTTWSTMDVAYKVNKGEEAASLIVSGIMPKPVYGAIVWGNYLHSYKDMLPAYKRLGNGEYTVNGRKIGNSRWRRILQLPAKLEIEVSKPGFRFGKDFLSRVSGVLGNIIRGKWAI